MEPNLDLSNQNQIGVTETRFILTKTKFKDIYF
jgi:hypothetical protein